MGELKNEKEESQMRLSRFFSLAVIAIVLSCLLCGGTSFAAALAADRDTSMRAGDSINIGVAAAKKIYEGALVARDANGYATPGATATTLVGIGRAEEQVDNSAGANGAKTVTVRKGIFKFGNSAAADAITDAVIGTNCYIVDDQTVAKTDGTATRSVAGKVFKVDSDGVWVDMRY